MNCLKFQNQLLDLIYDELSPEEKAASLSHRDSCPSCTEEFKTVFEAKNIFSLLPEKQPSGIIVNRIRFLAEEKAPVPFGVRISRALENIFGFGRSLVPGMVGSMAIAAFMFLFTQAGPQNPALSQNDEAVKTATYDKTTIPNLSMRVKLGENPFNLSGDASVQPVASSVFSFPSSVTELGNSEGDESDLSSDQLQKIYEARKKALLESDADSLLMRGRRLKAMGRIDLALTDFETIYHYYPDYTYIADVLVYRAQCFALQGKTEKAIESLSLYAEKEPSKTEVVKSMIRQLRTTGGFKSPY